MGDHDAHTLRSDREPDHLVLKHLLLGMAAHILLDLGVATHDTCDGPLAPRRADFAAIYRVLGGVLDDLQDDLNAVSPGTCARHRSPRPAPPPRGCWGGHVSARSRTSPP